MAWTYAFGFLGVWFGVVPWHQILEKYKHMVSKARQATVSDMPKHVSGIMLFLEISIYMFVQGHSSTL